MRKVSTLLTVLLISLCTCHWFASSPPTPLRGIILISLDTLRADHLGTYGYQRNTSPHIDAFAKEGVVFEHALVQSPWTLPSHMSIMTSLYPASHGVIKGVNRLADEHVTLAELLKKNGYRTAAFTDGGYTNSRFGFNQGFDIYQDKNRVGIARTIPKAKRWLKKNKQNQFFLFIHCFDIHDPYNPPPPYNKMFQDNTYKGSLIPDFKTLTLAARNKLKVNDDDLRYLIDLYDGGIRYTDEMVGEFFAYLRNTGLYDNSLIIVTSDHGEEFREHGSFRHHQFYYRPNLHVPLIIHIPGFPNKEVRIKELVQSIDILPTVLDIAHLPPHAKAQGRSLLPLINRDRNFLTELQWKILGLFNGPPPASIAEAPWPHLQQEGERSFIYEGYQLIYNIKSHSAQLFDIETDPLAQNNIAKEHTALVERLLSAFQEVNSALPHFDAPDLTFDEEIQKQLEALGYINPSEDMHIEVQIAEDDSDLDGISDTDDNCTHVPNSPQEDKDGDRIGDVCDNCPDVPNPDQMDANKNGVGDVCEPSHSMNH